VTLVPGGSNSPLDGLLSDGADNPVGVSLGSGMGVLLGSGGAVIVGGGGNVLLGGGTGVLLGTCIGVLLGGGTEVLIVGCTDVAGIVVAGRAVLVVCEVMLGADVTVRAVVGCSIGSRPVAWTEAALVTEATALGTWDNVFAGSAIIAPMVAVANLVCVNVGSIVAIAVAVFDNVAA
jgi:hypothetical protein